MNESLDLISISFVQRYVIGIRLYPDSTGLGWRWLGKGRLAIDFWRVSLILENYS